MDEAERACHCEESQTAKRSLFSDTDCFAEFILSLVEGLAMTTWLSDSE